MRRDLLSNTSAARKLKRLAAVGMAGTLLLSMSACSLLPEEEEFRQAPVVSGYVAAAFITAPVTRGDVETTVSLSLNYVPIRVASLCFGIAGKTYDEIYVSVGDAVKEGDLLAELDMGDLNDKIESTELSLENLRLQLKQNEEGRALALKKTKLAASGLSEEKKNEQLESVNKTYDMKKRDLEDQVYVAELHLEDYEAQKAERQIIAPFDGTVTNTYSFDPYETSSLTQTVVSVADSSMSLFRGSISEWDQIVSGTETEVVSDGKTLEAVFRTEEELGIEPTAHTEGKKGYVYLVLKETAYDLKDNASGKATVVLQSHKDVLAVPNRAISTINDEEVVYVPDENGLKTYRKVVTGLRGDTKTEIVSGLEEGERVVVN